MNRKVLITGGSGFIGSRVIVKLLEAGDSPVALKRNTTNLWRIKDFADKVTIYNIDEITLPDIFDREGFDAVINLATYYRKYSNYGDIENMIDSNVTLPTKLLELSVNHSVGLFVTAGTYFQYDTGLPILDPKESTTGRDLYAATKNALGKIMEYYSSKHNLCTVELILFTPYGEKDHEERVIPYIIKQAIAGDTVKLSHGFQKLNPVHVEDIAKAFVKSLEMECVASSNIRLNIASKRSYSIREIITVIEDIMDRHLNVVWNVVPTGGIDENTHLVPDNRLTENTLHWSPSIDLYAGLRRTIDYYRSVYDGS